MSRFLKKDKHEIGLPPDELMFIGKKKIDNILLRLIDFDTINMEEISLDKVKDVLKYQGKDSVTWFNVDGLHNQKVMKEIAQGFQLDKVILSDVMNTDYKQIDFIKGISHSYNLQMTTDESTKTVYIEPFDNFYKPYKDAIDWTAKLNRANEITDKWIDISDMKILWTVEIDCG
jgi:magnesium transporter